MPQQMSVEAGNIQSGDIVVLNGFRWKVKKVRRSTLRGQARTNFRCDWDGQGARPWQGTENIRFSYRLTSGVIRVGMPACHPCYDSDCMCIYDTVRQSSDF
jgi:hypothetical protein